MSSSSKESHDTLALATLEEAALALGLIVRYDDLGSDEYDATSGRCTVRQQTMIIIDTRLDIAGRWRALAQELSSFDTESVWLSPLARQLIGSCRKETL